MIDRIDKEIKRQKFHGAIRALESEDLDQIKPILETWMNWMGKIIAEEVEQTMETFESSIDSNELPKFFVAEDIDGQVVGVVGIKKPDPRMIKFARTKKPLELINAYVGKEHRKGRGVGRRLVENLEKEAIEKGYEEIILNSGPRYRNSGWPFYDKIGYERIGVAEKYYDNRWDAPVWGKILKQ